jgi:hypothetical protein
MGVRAEWEGTRKNRDRARRPRSKFALRLTVPSIVMVGVLVLIAYQVYNGLMFQEVGFGQFSIKFAPPSSKGPETIEATREFFIGRWQVEQRFAAITGTVAADYLEDGSFSESQQVFQGDNGRRMDRTGHWEFAKQAKDRFRLTLNFSDGQKWNGDFTIVNHDRIHNIYENYDAVRVPR